MFVLQSWTWKHQQCRLLAGSERNMSGTVSTLRGEDKAHFSPHHVLWLERSSQQRYTASACLLQAISYSLCIGRETNQFPSAASSSDCQIFFFSLLSTILSFWEAFSYSSFTLFVTIKWVKVNPLTKVKNVEQKTLSPPNKAQHFSTLLILLCHTGICNCLPSMMHAFIWMIMLVCAGLGKASWQMPKEQS